MSTWWQNNRALVLIRSFSSLYIACLHPLEQHSELLGPGRRIKSTAAIVATISETY